MITIADLDRALSLMQQHGLQTLRVREGSTMIALTLSEGGAAPEPVRSEFVVQAKGIGRLLLRHPQQQEPVVQPGDVVAGNTIVGFLENGPVLLPILAGKPGAVGTINEKEGALLGYGSPVLTVLEA